MDEQVRRISALAERIAGMQRRLQSDGQSREVHEARTRSADPDFWNDPAAAERMRRIARITETQATWSALAQCVNDLGDLIAVAMDSSVEERDAITDDLTREIGAAESRFAELEAVALFTGTYDDHNAVLSIRAGAGGLDAQNWAAMLLRMYTRWTGQRSLRTDILDRSFDAASGIKSATIRISGEHAYGLLRSERGVHRLVRISPFGSSTTRQTSFALVEVVPELRDTTDAVAMPPNELRIDTYRASGNGGQNVQKNSTAVRITHLPTGLVATCQNERSLRQNRAIALRVLHSRLHARAVEERETALAALRGARTDAAWGHHIRSYVLHPDRLVKDMRTGHETSDAEAVLDGDLDSFMEAWLRDQLLPDSGAV